MWNCLYVHLLHLKSQLPGGGLQHFIVVSLLHIYSQAEYCVLNIHPFTGKSHGKQMRRTITDENQNILDQSLLKKESSVYVDLI